MKFVFTWKPRLGGSATENEAGVARVLEVYSKWTPPSDATFHQFVVRADGEGGFAVVEGDDPAGLALSIFKLFPFLEYAVYPVIDVEDAVGLLTEAVQFRKSVKYAGRLAFRPCRERAVICAIGSSHAPVSVPRLTLQSPPGTGMPEHHELRGRHGRRLGSLRACQAPGG